MFRRLQIAAIGAACIILIIIAPSVFGGGPSAATPQYLPGLHNGPTPTLSPVPTATPLPQFTPVANGTFEQGHKQWTEIPGNAVITQFAAVQPYSGQWLAQLGGSSNSTSEIQQSIKLPAAAHLVLRYAYRTNANGSGADTFRVLINTTSIDFDLPISESDWLLVTRDITAFAGQAVTLRFQFTTGASTPPSLVYIDDVALGVTP